ncbi:MAG: hypothetical protein GY754_08560 [bacterium]|nr:hypothetical protein [bacterium]
MGTIDRISQKNAMDRMIGEKLESHSFSDKLKGKPLKIRSVNFTVSLEKQILAYAGVPEYMKRAKLVEEKISGIKSGLQKKYNDLDKKLGNNSVTFNKAWNDLLESYDFQAVNELIKKHNLLYPQEANLKIDPDTREYLLGSEIWEKTPLMDRSLIIEELPFK